MEVNPLKFCPFHSKYFLPQSTSHSLPSCQEMGNLQIYDKNTLENNSFLGINTEQLCLRSEHSSHNYELIITTFINVNTYDN